MQPSKERGFSEWKLPLGGWVPCESFGGADACIYTLEVNKNWFFFNNIINNCVAKWSWVPGMSRGFNFWQSQPPDSYVPWLENQHRPPSHEFPRQWKQAPFTLIIREKTKGERGGGKCTIQRFNKVSGHQENAVLTHRTDASKADRTWATILTRYAWHSLL